MTPTLLPPPPTVTVIDEPAQPETRPKSIRQPIKPIAVVEEEELEYPDSGRNNNNNKGGSSSESR